MKAIMRYNIMRLVNEITAYKKELPNIDRRVFTVPYRTKQIQHAIALCYKLIGQEIEIRILNGESLNLAEDKAKLEEWEK